MAVAHGQVLQKFCRYKIDDHDETNAGEHQRRWRFEAEPVPSGREGKRHRHDQCDQRRRCQNRIRKILPRAAISTNDEDDEDLRRHRLEKPGGLEFGRRCLEKENQRGKCQEVEQR